MRNYLSLVKFSHTVFAMPFALIGFFLGIYEVTRYPDMPDQDTAHFLRLFGLILICMVTARNAAMAFNRYVDRKFDERNPRTAVREIPSGIITPANALAFVLINCVIFVAATWFINELCFYLSPVALAVILGYSLTKRFTFLCHLILGVGLGLAPVGAFLAVAGHFQYMPVLFGFTVFFWVSGFDILYALQDEQFDKEHQLYSIPAKFGQHKAIWISRLLHLWSFAGIVYIGKYGQFSFLFWMAAAIFGGLLVYQHFVVQHYGLKKIDLAFFTLNGVASVLFGLLVITDIIMHF